MSTKKWSSKSSGLGKEITFIKLKECDEDTVLIEDGLYAGSFVGGKYKSTTHLFDEDGKRYGFSGNQLNYLVDEEELEIGDNVRVVYLGKQEVKEGKNKGDMAHTFELFVCREESVEEEEVLVEKVVEAPKKKEVKAVKKTDKITAKKKDESKKVVAVVDEDEDEDLSELFGA
jgi:hypothetical protein